MTLSRNFLSGCSRQYWVEVIQQLYDNFGTDYFSYKQVCDTCQMVNKSVMRKLATNSVILKSPFYGTRRVENKWCINPEIIEKLALKKEV